MTRGSQPASCTAIGCSSGQLCAIVKDCRVSRIAAWLAIISETTSAAPDCLTMRRNGRSVTPDIGARITASSTLTEPRQMLTDCSILLNAHNLGRYSTANFVALQHRMDRAAASPISFCFGLNADQHNMSSGRKPGTTL